MYDYAIRFERDDTAPGLAVFCRDLPELNSYGDHLEHALNQAVDAIESTLSLYVDQRRPIPPASPPIPGEHVIRLPATTVAKIALWNALHEHHLHDTAPYPPQESVLVDFTHNADIEQVEHALSRLGKRLVVQVAEAA